MGIASVVELPREFDQEIAKPALCRRRWVVNLTDDQLQSPTSEVDIIQNTASPTLAWGVLHPTFAYLKLRKFSMQENYEGDPYKALATAEYGLLEDDEITAPVDRPAVWAASASAAEVPVMYYYSGTGNGTRYPLTNSAYDYFQGITTLESQIQFTVVKNYGPPVGAAFSSLGAYFPYTQLSAINHLNNAVYGGSAIHTFKCAGVTVSRAIEPYGNQVARYWETTSTLLYRQTGWNLQLPDVGYNYLASGQKRRAMVFDFENGEWIASPNPVGLDGFGNQTGGAPAILVRRVLPEANFTSIFGAMPT